ncbi:MAG: HEAT repeat domain-containing protein [Myxococcota bacterium]|jgi:hypothetical protein|nr:HEAT repeat domain-containing protein [Myxococcota bacterium]
MAASCLHKCALSGLGAAATLCVALFGNAQGEALPEGLFSADSAQRVAAISDVEATRNTAAQAKLVSMVREDSHAEVREAACRALGALDAQSELPLLLSVALGDPNAAVRAAAAKAARLLRGEQEPTAGKALVPTATSAGEDAAIGAPSAQGEFKQPTLLANAEAEVTRRFAVGFGSMGGYGLLALDLRLRLSTTSELLPWVGIELGGGWTPPEAFQLIAGRMDDTRDEDNLGTKTFSYGAAALLYVHREHYVPIRFGFNLVEGPFGALGYGYEALNPEGFFSWGFEVGINIHPGMHNFVDTIVDCEPESARCGKDDLWPVVPYVRLSLHFYPL